MKQNRTLFFLFALAQAISAVLPAPAEADTPHLSLNLAGPTHVNCGEPAILDAEVKNCGATAFSYQASDLDCDLNRFPNVKVLIESNGKQQADLRRDLENCCGGGSREQLMPLQSVKKRLLLNRWSTIAEPGLYTVALFYPTDGVDQNGKEQGFTSNKIVIKVERQPKEEAAAYIQANKTKLDDWLRLVDKVTTHKATEAEVSAYYDRENLQRKQWPFGANPADEYIQKLMFTCDPSLIPYFIGLLNRTGQGHDHWVVEALLHYLPRDTARTALVAQFTTKGLSYSGLQMIRYWGSDLVNGKPFALSDSQWKNIIAASLAPTNKDSWISGCQAAYDHPFDSNMTQLAAIACDRNSPARDAAARALMANRTEESVRAIRELLKEKDPNFRNSVKQYISNAFINPTPGKPFLESDFDPALLPPRSERASVRKILETPTNIAKAVPGMSERFILTAPPSYKLSAHFPKKKYFIGENPPLSFELQNTGNKTIGIDTGGDYRFAPRPIRFQVTARTANGINARDPHPHPFCEGGLDMQTPIAPGDKYETKLDFAAYRSIEEPGKYKVSVSHDFGWTNLKAPPTATTEIEFVYPTLLEARQNIENIFKHLSNGQHSANDIPSESKNNITALSAPIYLPLLLEKTRSSSEVAAALAVKGIGSIATPQSTDALIRLASDPRPKVSKEALSQLVFRVPDPKWKHSLPPRNALLPEYDSERKWLAARSWRSEFGSRCNTLANGLLKSKDQDICQKAAFLLECTGTVPNQTALLKALGDEIANSQSTKERHDFHMPPDVGSELIRATVMQVKRGWLPPFPPQTSAESAAFLIGIANNPSYRPNGWEKQLLSLINSDVPYLAELALVCAPKSLNNDVATAIPKLLASKSSGVRIEACSFVSRTPALTSSSKGALLDLISKTNNSQLLREASQAASQIGAKIPALNTLAGRLSDTQISSDALMILISSCLDTGDFGGSTFTAAEAPAVAKAWLTLIAENSTKLDKGALLSISDPRINLKLLAPGFQFSKNKRPSTR